MRPHSHPITSGYFRERTAARSAGYELSVLLVALAVATLAVFIGVEPIPAGAQTRSEKIDDLRRKIDEASDRQKTELEQIEASDNRLNEAEALIQQLEGQVAEARARVAQTQKELDVATAKVKEAEARLAEVESNLRAAQDHVNRRAVDLYKTGKNDESTALLESGSINELQINLAYERRLQRRDQAVVESLVASVKDVTELRHELESARISVEERRNAFAAEKKALEASLADQKKIRDALAKEIENHKRLLVQIEQEQNKYEAALEELEGQSRRVGGLYLSRGSGSGKLVWPADGPVTSRFGMRNHPILRYARLHAGVDIGAGYGSTVIASASGTVASAAYSGGYGNMIVIDHGDGLATAYCHLSRIGVSKGQQVTQKQNIGAVGSTGLSSGPHLHFETRVNGSPVDPLGYFT